MAEQLPRSPQITTGARRTPLLAFVALISVAVILAMALGLSDKPDVQRVAVVSIDAGSGATAAGSPASDSTEPTIENGLLPTEATQTNNNASAGITSDASTEPTNTETTNTEAANTEAANTEPQSAAADTSVAGQTTSNSDTTPNSAAAATAEQATDEVAAAIEVADVEQPVEVESVTDSAAPVAPAVPQGNADAISTAESTQDQSETAAEVSQSIAKVEQAESLASDDTIVTGDDPTLADQPTDAVELRTRATAVAVVEPTPTPVGLGGAPIDGTFFTKPDEEAGATVTLNSVQLALNSNGTGTFSAQLEMSYDDESGVSLNLKGPFTWSDASPQIQATVAGSYTSTNGDQGEAITATSAEITITNLTTGSGSLCTTRCLGFTF